jgi:hypothetical protein
MRAHRPAPKGIAIHHGAAERLHSCRVVALKEKPRRVHRRVDFSSSISRSRSWMEVVLDAQGAGPDVGRCNRHYGRGPAAHPASKLHTPRSKCSRVTRRGGLRQTSPSCRSWRARNGRSAFEALRTFDVVPVLVSTSEFDLKRTFADKFCRRAQRC